MRRARGWPAAAGAEVVEVLVAEGGLVADGPVLRRPGYGVRLDPAQQALQARVEATLEEAGVDLLSGAALRELGADRKATALLVRLGVLVAIAPGGWLGRRAGGSLATLRRSFRTAARSARGREPAPPAAPPSHCWSTGQHRAPYPGDCDADLWIRHRVAEW